MHKSYTKNMRNIFNLLGKKGYNSLNTFIFLLYNKGTKSFKGVKMQLSDKEIEEKIEKTVYKLEKFYKLYNIIYKIRGYFRKVKELIFKNFFSFLVLYTLIILILVRCL